MSHSQEEFSIHLAQALSYLHSGHHHIKTWAVLFIGERGLSLGPQACPTRVTRTHPGRPSPAPATPLQLELRLHRQGRWGVREPGRGGWA